MAPILNFLPRRLPDEAPRDRELVRRLREGDRSALDEALGMHWASTVEFAAGRVERLEDAKDIVQEAFIRLWEGAHRWEPETEIRALLFGIVRNLAMKESRRNAMKASHAGPARDLTRSRSSDPADQAVARELEGAIIEAVRRLPERRREVFLLSRQDGLSHREIAERLGISTQTVANQLTSALAELRNVLKPHLTRSTPKPDLRLISEKAEPPSR